MAITLENFTVKGGYANGTTYPHSYGGGLSMQGPIDVYADDITITIRDLIVRNNYSDGGGGGIFMSSKMNYYLYDTDVTDNSADSWGNGIYAGGYGTTYLSYVDLYRNTGPGSGMYINSAGTKTLSHCYFMDNAGTFVDSLYISKSNATYSITYGGFYPNTKPAIGITVTGATSLTISNVWFGGDPGNTSAAIYESQDISGHTITNNKFLVSYYGALYKEGSTVTITDNASGLALLNTANHTSHDASTASGNTIE